MINNEFFTTVNPADYIQGDGKVARNKLKKDYERFLYDRSLPRMYDPAELSRAVVLASNLKDTPVNEYKNRLVELRKDISTLWTKRDATGNQNVKDDLAIEIYHAELDIQHLERSLRRVGITA